ncbi:ABC transporter substrate-binding protein [Peribacillus sp. NPDC097675]|uniref:ABC transporter substrate-binding protein n=1 Tax=Peribacillus sp. NPDC097675 TaxID=3390618 RepID=UPI003D063231
MKKRWTMIAATTAMVALITGCGNSEDNTKGNTSDKQTTAEEKVIQDQLGRDVTVPGKVERIAVGGILPYFSTWYVATNSTKEVVGLHPNAYNAAENSILADMSPDILKADTSFIKNGEVNVEELMKVNPQLYFEKAQDQKTINKLEDAGVSVVALNPIEAAAAEPLATFNSWLELTGEITGTTERTDKFLKKGKAVQAELNKKLEGIKKKDKPRALILYQHSDKSIMVGGKNFFSNQWLNATGAYDIAAEEVTGTKEVNMEQIYKWNPDIIYITNFTTTQPEDLTKNKVNGQDWSQVRAVQEGNVYKIPLGIYRWFPPSGDAPLMLKWMAQKNHPELFDYDMKDEITDYYSEFYDYDVTEEQVENILHPSSEAAKQ